MEHVLVVVFDSAEDAYEASRALESLNEESIIAFNAGVVLTTNLQGLTTIVKTRGLDPQATMGGTAVGSLLGAIAGPVGLAVGATTGFVVGALADFQRAQAASHFTTDVVSALERGKAALVADVDEERTDLVDERMQALGGRVSRHELSELADKEYERDVAKVENTIADTHAEYAAARAKRGGRLRHWVDAAVGKLIRYSLRRT